jgi:predicted phage replisome organizer
VSDNKKYYYLKLKENFFDSEEMIILQNMPDGYLYSDILMKLYLRSLKNEGKLMFRDLIPYTPTALAQVVRHQVGTVEKALKVFQQLGLIELLDNGAIYMLDIQNFIGQSSTEADRKRDYRKKIDGEIQLLGQMSDKCPDKSPPEIELDIEKELELKLEKDIDIKPKKPVVKINFDLYAQEYNNRCDNLPKVKVVTEKRKEAIRKFNREFTLDQFKEICDIANNNDFLTGRNNRGWTADFDFLLRVDKATAILEGGKYSNSEPKPKSSGDKLKEMIQGGIFDD